MPGKMAIGDFIGQLVELRPQKDLARVFRTPQQSCEFCACPIRCLIEEIPEREIPERKLEIKQAGDFLILVVISRIIEIATQPGII